MGEGADLRHGVVPPVRGPGFVRIVWIRPIRCQDHGLDLAPSGVTIRIAADRNSVKLLSERDLAVEFGVSYLTVRHAKAVLREHGLIVSIHGRGTYIIPGRQPPGKAEGQGCLDRPGRHAQSSGNPPRRRAEPSRGSPRRRTAQQPVKPPSPPAPPGTAPAPARLDAHDEHVGPLMMMVML